MAINDGGFWYPSLIPYAPASDRGATVRDVFAAHALAVMGCLPELTVDRMEEDWAAVAYRIADAMIAQRAADYRAAGQDAPAPAPVPADRELPWRLDLDPDPAS